MVVVAQVAQRNDDLIASCDFLLVLYLLYSHVTRNHINPFKPNEISHCYQLDLSISDLRVVGW